MEEANDRDMEELVAAYASDELSGEEAVRFEEALLASPRLREELDRYERVFVLLAAAAREEVKVPRGLRARVVWRVAITSYLDSAFALAGGLLGAYGRAFVYYLRLA